MKKIIIENFKLGEEVLITSFTPPAKAKIADMYELPYEQIPMTGDESLKKYYGKNVPIFEVFLEGKVRSFVGDVVTKIK